MILYLFTVAYFPIIAKKKKNLEISENNSGRKGSNVDNCHLSRA